MTSPCVYQYTKEDLIFKSEWGGHNMSTFDESLTNKWIYMQESNQCFKYRLKIDNSKILKGKYQFLAQLNKDRASLRRKPDVMQSMKQKFDPNTFNFTKVDSKEILFEIINRERNQTGNFIAINVSPLEFGHCLLLPALNSCLPQVITQESLLTAIELFLLSKSPSMRMGFNGLCAYASLNHLHFHLYYLQHQMLLETIEVQHLSGPCHMLLSFPSRGFVFQLSQGQDIQEFVRCVYKLVNYLQEAEKPHNLFITRGSSFQSTVTAGLVRDHVRVYVWTRKPVYGAKNSSAEDQVERMSPAICELFGQLLIKTSEDYDNLTEEFVSNMLSDITSEPFNSVVDQVKDLFKDDT